MEGRVYDKSNYATYLMNYLGKFYYDRMNKKLNEVDISRIMFFNMLYIKRNPNVAMNVLAREFGIDKSYITRIIARLLELELVRKKTSTKDSRVQLLSLTQRGEEYLENIFSYLITQEKELYSLLTKDEYSNLIGALQKIYSKHIQE